MVLLITQDGRNLTADRAMDLAPVTTECCQLHTGLSVGCHRVLEHLDGHARLALVKMHNLDHWLDPSGVPVSARPIAILLLPCPSRQPPTELFRPQTPAPFARDG